MTKSRRASDQRRDKHRAFNGYLTLTEGSLALEATETSPLTISLYSRGSTHMGRITKLPQLKVTPQIVMLAKLREVIQHQQEARIHPAYIMPLLSQSPIRLSV